jgi:prepilin-type processing-associated H-X9-DG protein
MRKQAVMRAIGVCAALLLTCVAIMDHLYLGAAVFAWAFCFFCRTTVRELDPKFKMAASTHWQRLWPTYGMIWGTLVGLFSLGFGVPLAYFDGHVKPLLVIGAFLGTAIGCSVSGFCNAADYYRKKINQPSNQRQPSDPNQLSLKLPC